MSQFSHPTSDPDPVTVKEDPNVPQSSEVSVVAKPRRPFRLTGERLGNKVQLAQALLRAGATITKTAKDLGISRHSAQAIAARMRTPALAALPGAQGAQNVQQEFDTYVRGDLQRVAKLALTNITPEKAEGSSLRDLSFAVDKTLSRLEAIDARASNLGMLAGLMREYGIEPSHAVSRVTLEEKVILETKE